MEEPIAAISGAVETNATRHFPFIEEAIKKSRKKKLVAWVVGPGGYSYRLTEPAPDLTQEIEFIVKPRFGGPSKSLEHAEIKRILEKTRKPHSLYVIDLLPQNLEIAKETLKQQGLDTRQARFLHANIAEQTPPEKADIIVCHDVLPYMSSSLATETLQKLFQSLHKNGVLSISRADASHVPSTTLKKILANTTKKKISNYLLIIKKSPKG
ncbi:MAG: methyltransferase domain-containing protein [Candidatus Micrarchaeia archaeon]|jgi:hypothetical protein